EFSEGYGRNVEVPLKEIIDPNKFDGLSLIETKLKAVSEREKKIRKVVDDKIVSALINDQEEVILTKKDFNKVVVEHTKHRAPKSFDMNFLITTDDGKFNVTIGPNKGSF